MNENEHESRAARLMLAAFDEDRARFDAALAETGITGGTPAAGMLRVLAHWCAFSLTTLSGEDDARKVFVNIIMGVDATEESGR